MLIEQMTKRLYDQNSVERAVSVILDDSIALHGAELGNVQLNAGGYLVIVVHRGFKARFLETFRKVTVDDGCACGRALRTRGTVIVSEIETDAGYAPYRDAIRTAGIKSAMTTPLLTTQGFLVGAVSTHFVNPHTPTSIEVAAIKTYCGVAADYLVKLLGEDSIEQKALSMNRRAYEEAGAV